MEYLDERDLDGGVKEEIMGYGAKKEYIKAEKKLKKREEKERARDERYKLKAAAIREKNRRKAEMKENREYMKAERKRRKAERKAAGGSRAGGLIAAVVSLGLSTVILATALIYTTLITPASGETDASYRKSFYDTVAQVNNMDLNLSKTLATKDRGAAQTYLVDLAINSELAENDLQRLPITDENKFYTTKIVNQVGDYAKYLNGKIARGESLTGEDYENLRNLYKANLALKDALKTAMDDINGDYNFAEMGKNTDDNFILKNFAKLQELSVEYPELIYDGPFSDGKDGETINGLTGGEITESEAEDIFREMFYDYSPKNVRCTGKSAGQIETFNIEGEIKGEILYAAITVKGGKLLAFSYAGSCKEVNYGEKSATLKAAAFLEKAGFTDMKAVWINLSNNVYTINFAPEINGVIIYPDLVKARVCAETGMVIGLEASGYIKNHRERILPSAALTKGEARKFVSDDISVETGRLALVPVGSSAEKLCYEFSGTFGGETYYVYIDAMLGRQVEMFKVINAGESGSLLM